MAKRKYRRRLSSAEKVKLLKEHFVEKTAISDICDKYKIHPNQFYKWQKEFFDKSLNVFDSTSKNPTIQQDKKIAALETKLAQKNEVVSELLEEHIKLKKNFGEL